MLETVVKKVFLLLFCRQQLSNWAAVHHVRIPVGVKKLEASHLKQQAG